ncbi:uncharacterized protein PRCAT00003925001 [Priceomyces carsonii]|uniref:uncharacterized protein n=1 Tax=Priceomyces carsonii TaxID=28549 RepID=UPI002ED99D6F|nr:unnamed protein product [Priceomyces carsonii]
MTVDIVVVGAGVSGLTSALLLKQSNKDYNVTVVGYHIPGDLDIDYTSPFAGGNWHSFASKEDKFLQQIDEPGYKKFMELARTEPQAGIWIQPNVEYITKYDFDKKGRDPLKYVPWFKDLVEDFKILDSHDLPDGIAFGFSFSGVIISVPIYLNYLLQKNLEIGNTIKRVRKLKDIQEARYVNGTKANIVVNATGLLAPQLKGYKDPKRNFPVKGQVLHVRNKAKHELSVEGFPGYDSEMLYIMPRKEGGSIIGGCFLIDDNTLKIDDVLTQRIIKRAVKYMPELIDKNFDNNPPEIDIVRTNVGLRPFREGGVRIEIDPDNKWLIHNYGIGGGGYQGSYGLAEKVVSLTNKSLTSNSSRL